MSAEEEEEEEEEEEGKETGGTHQVGFPETLAHAEELLGGGAADDEVLGEVDAADGVEAADEGGAGLGVEAGDDGADEVGAEAALVEGGGDEVGEGGGGDGALLAQAVHVDLVAEQVRDGGHVGGEAGEPEEDGVAVLEDLGEVVGHGQGLQAEAQVAGDGHAVLAYHGHAGAAVCFAENEVVSLEEAMFLYSYLSPASFILYRFWTWLLGRQVDRRTYRERRGLRGGRVS